MAIGNNHPEDEENAFHHSQNTILELYKLYVEMADRVSQRRATANSFFLTLETGLFGLSISLAGLSSSRIEYQVATIAAAGFGLPFSVVWWRILESYRQLNRAKFQVVHEIEQKLPIAPYGDEWVKVGKGADPKLYRPLTAVEGWVPILFGAGHLGAIILGASLIIFSS